MDFVGNFPITRKGHEYMFVVVDIFSNICIIVPCKKTIMVQYATIVFLESVWVHFQIQRIITSKRHTRFSQCLLE
jgi:hypothetical protein